MFDQFNKRKKSLLALLVAFLMGYLGLEGLDSFQDPTNIDEKSENIQDNNFDPGTVPVKKDGHYTDAQNVTDFIEAFGELPDNYLTKDEAYDLGWEPDQGNLDQVAPGMSIGGDYFGNFEERLPDSPGRSYYEADINYDGGYRGPKRLVFSDDGLYFYTSDHYETFDEVKPGE